MRISDWSSDVCSSDLRDFTFNALSANPVTGAIFDYFGGLEDLRRHHVRFIGSPLERIAEDHLRILRFFRFHARFGEGLPDPEGLAACAARANEIGRDTSELQSIMRISYAVFCLKKKTANNSTNKKRARDD